MCVDNESIIIIINDINVCVMTNEILMKIMILMCVMCVCVCNVCVCINNV